MIQGGRWFLRVSGVITSRDKTHSGQLCISKLPQRGIAKINKLVIIKHFKSFWTKGSMEVQRIT